MKITKSEDKIWEENKGYYKKILLDEKDLNSSGSLIQKIRIKKGETVETHYHKKQTEVFYFLTKEDYWIINEKKYSFEIGDTLIIEPFDKHEIVNNGVKDSVYLVFKINNDAKDLYWGKN